MNKKTSPFRAWAGPIAWLTLLLMHVSGVALAVPANPFDAPVLHPAIPILDEEGKHVLDTGKPYSTRMTCGNGNGSGCHDYDKMNHAYHFEQGRDEADDLFGVRRGVNHMTSPGYFGGYNCVQGSATGALAKKVNPDAANFGEWGAAGFLKACGTCHMGGGWEEKDRDGIRYDQRAANTIPFGDGDYYERDSKAEKGLSLFNWKASGVREADCMTCHADFSSLEKKGLPAQFAAAGTSTAYEHWGYLQDRKFVAGNFFRYANSAMLEFLNLKPGDANFPDGLNLLSVARQDFKAGTTYKPDYALDLDANGQPKLTWNAGAFDANGKVQIPMLRFPGDANCMMCHLASGGINRISSGKGNGSRRGFHGFGDDAAQTTDSQGIVAMDYKDDVHKGKSWTDDNGETRVIDNCNACHAKEYYKSRFANVALDADHNFPKGNGDNDIRRDLDNYPGPLSCKHCHDDGVKHPALPSGQKNALDAHRELWKSSGDMFGYTADTLNKIVQTHLDTVACETCHIPKIIQDYGKDAAGNLLPSGQKDQELTLRYRYRPGEDGKMKIIPYKPHTRYYAQDKNSGRVLYRYETNPSASLKTYDEWKALKQSYDEKLKAKGYANPDVQFVQTESNEYIVAHQTRTSPESVQCEQCHTKKQNGSFSSLVSTEGLFGAGNVATVIQLPDKRLVDEGIVKLGKPYFKVDDTGKVTENAADVLEATRTNPSMSLFNAAVAKDASGEWKRVPMDEGLDLAAVSKAEERQKLGTELGSSDVFLFDVRSAAPELKAMALLAESTALSDALFPRYRLDVELAEIPADQAQATAAALAAKPVSGAYSLKVSDHQTRKPLTTFQGAKVFAKLPYQGKMADSQKIKVLSMEGGNWVDTGIRPTLLHLPEPVDGTNLPGGLDLEDPALDAYVVVAVDQPFAALALADETPKSCGLPWGGSLAHGQSITAYSTAQNSLCSAVAETRACDNGTLSGSFTNQNCSAPATTPAKASCTLPWGGSLPDGGSVTAYRDGISANCSAVSETRTCANGTLSGSYANVACSPAPQAPGACSLPWGGSLAHGQTVTAYSAAESKLCSAISEVRTCDNGVLSGNFTKQACTTVEESMDPANWRDVEPLGACTAKACTKALSKARAKLKAKARAANEAAAAAQAAAVKAAKDGLAPKAKAKAEAAAARKAARAETAQQAYELAAAVVQGLRD